MIRFNNTKVAKKNKLLIFKYDVIRRLFGGDRLKRISKEITDISKKIYLKKQKKIIILDFGCGSMEISKKLKKYSFVRKIVGIDTFYFKFKKGFVEINRKFQKIFNMILVIFFSTPQSIFLQIESNK